MIKKFSIRALKKQFGSPWNGRSQDFSRGEGGGSSGSHCFKVCFRHPFKVVCLKKAYTREVTGTPGPPWLSRYLVLHYYASRIIVN